MIERRLMISIINKNLYIIFGPILARLFLSSTNNFLTKKHKSKQKIRYDELELIRFMHKIITNLKK